MRTLFAQSPALLSPTRRPLRSSRPLPKNIPLLEHDASLSPVQRRRMCESSPSPRRPSLKKRDNFELCSSGAVLVLAKKVKPNDRLSPNRQTPNKKSTQNGNLFRTVDEDLFCQRSQQKYRIRSRGRNYERTQATITPAVADFGRMPASVEMGRICIEPWGEMGVDELSDLF